MSADSKEPLSISEVLHLLRHKVIPGISLPEHLNHSPWRIPNENSPHSHIINALLEKSFSLQSSHIPESGGEFDEYILSNASLAIAGLLHQYLISLGINSVSISFGTLLWDPNTRLDSSDYEATPHLWLTIENTNIDNAYVSFPNPEALEYFYKSRSSSSYLSENPFETSKLLYLGQDDVEDSSFSTVKHNMRVYRSYADSKSIEKYLVFALGIANLNPSVKMYDILMKDFILSAHGIKIPDLEEKWRTQCWNCTSRSSEESLKTCSRCAFGKYCNVNCQKAEWSLHKILHKELKYTKEILSLHEMEEKEMANIKRNILEKKAKM